MQLLAAARGEKAPLAAASSCILVAARGEKAPLAAFKIAFK